MRGRLGSAEGEATDQLSPALAGREETGPTVSRAWATATSKPTLDLSDACPVGDGAKRSLEGPDLPVEQEAWAVLGAWARSQAV